MSEYPNRNEEITTTETHQVIVPIPNVVTGMGTDAMAIPPLPDQTVEVHHRTKVFEAFKDIETAEKVVAARLDHGINIDDVMIYMRDGSGNADWGATQEVSDMASKGITFTTPEDARAGAAKGAGIGLGVGILAGLAAIALPGIGLVLASSVVATAAAGAVGAGVAGAISGGIYGYLRDQGTDDYTAEAIRGRFEAGEIIVEFQCDTVEESSTVRGLSAKYGGEQVIAPIPASTTGVF